MTPAGGAQAQHEAQRVWRKVALIGMRHNRGIEQSSRLERIFVGEKSSQQQFSFDGQLPVGDQVGSHLLEPPMEELSGLQMTFAELGQDMVEQRPDFLLR